MTRDSKDSKSSSGRSRKRHPNRRQPMIKTDTMTLLEPGASLPEMPSEFELNRMFAQMVVSERVYLMISCSLRPACSVLNDVQVSLCEKGEQLGL